MTDVQAVTALCTIAIAVALLAAVIALRASARSRHIERRIDLAIGRNATRRARDEHTIPTNGAGRR